jgi:HEPN domain-containing protein
MEEMINYWIKSPEKDKEVLEILYKRKKYSHALFFGHLILEKILKAHVVKQTKKRAPYIHDLVRLCDIAKVDVMEKERDLLFNVNAL